jgi:hypothetical protein
MTAHSRHSLRERVLSCFEQMLIAGRSVVCDSTVPFACVFLNLQIFLLGASSMSNNIARELTTIIVPCWGQLEFTQQCLASLKEHTRPASELIVIDIAPLQEWGDHARAGVLVFTAYR